MSKRPKPAGAPGIEVEITPEMIAAGVEQITSYDLDYEDREDAVARIFEAMTLARKARLSAS